MLLLHRGASLGSMSSSVLIVVESLGEKEHGIFTGISITAHFSIAVLLNFILPPLRKYTLHCYHAICFGTLGLCIIGVLFPLLTRFSPADLETVNNNPN